MSAMMIWCLDGALLGLLTGMWLRGHLMTLTLSLFLAIVGAFGGALLCMAVGANHSSSLISLFMLMIGVATAVLLIGRINRH